MVANARAAEVTQQLIISSDLAESVKVIELAKRYGLYATAGVHPHHAKEWSNSSAAQLYDLLHRPRVVALGECGLDFNRNFSSPEAQITAFAAQLQMAAELQLPVYMHCRDAHPQFIRQLSPLRERICAAVLHCFTGSDEELDACLQLDLYIGITGWINDERRGAALREQVKRIPLNRLLLETDAPYLLPRDLSPKPASRRNEPCHLPHVAATVARLRNIDYALLCAHTSANAQRLFLGMSAD